MGHFLKNIKNHYSEQSRAGLRPDLKHENLLFKIVNAPIREFPPTRSGLGSPTWRNKDTKLLQLHRRATSAFRERLVRAFMAKKQHPSVQVKDAHAWIVGKLDNCLHCFWIGTATHLPNLVLVEGNVFLFFFFVVVGGGIQRYDA